MLRSRSSPWPQGRSWLSRRFALYTIATVALMLVFGAWSAMEIPQIEAGLATPWIGARERVFWHAYQLWFAALALALLCARPAPRTLPDATR